MGKDEPLLSNCPLETAEPSRNYARAYVATRKNTRKRREKKRKMNGVEINTRAYVATRLLLRWDYLYAVTFKTKVFGDYNHARLEVSWITSTRGLLLRGYTGARADWRGELAPLMPFYSASYQLYISSGDVTGFCSSFPLAEFPFPLFSVPLVNISIVFSHMLANPRKKKKFFGGSSCLL